MNTLQNIFNKIASKTELEKHEVKLNVTKELEFIAFKTNTLIKLINRLSEDGGKNQIKLSEALDEKKRLIKEHKLYVAGLQEVSDAFNKLENKFTKQTNELGININDVPIGKEFLKSKETFKILEGRLEALLSLITRY